MTDGGELENALFFLQHQRDAVVRKIAGLTMEQASRPGVPSGTNLAWIVQHMVAGERHWLGDDLVDDWEQASAPPPDATVESLVAAYRAAASRSDSVLRGYADLGRTGGREQSARWRLAHMLEETARHAGHADIIREQIDGSTGR